MTREKIVELARSYLRQYREVERAWTEAALPRIKVACVDDRGRWSGCSYCCYQLTMGTLINGVLIAHRLLQTGDVARLRSVCAQGTVQSKYLKGPNPAARYFQHRHPCALLLDDGRCSVFDLRPAACSTYYVVEGTPCASADSSTKIRSLDNHQLMMLSVVSDGAFLSDVLGDSKWSNAILAGPLGMMVKVGWLLLEDRDAFEAFIETC